MLLHLRRRGIFQVAEVLSLAAVDDDDLAVAAGGTAEEAARAVPDHHAELPRRHVLQLEVAVLVRYREIRMIEHANPPIHPWVDIALDLDRDAMGLQVLDGDLAVGGHED